MHPLTIQRQRIGGLMMAKIETMKGRVGSGKSAHRFLIGKTGSPMFCFVLFCFVKKKRILGGTKHYKRCSCKQRSKRRKSNKSPGNSSISIHSSDGK